MRRQRIAVFGLGRLGRACVEAVLACNDIELAGIVRRPECVLRPLPSHWPSQPVFAHWCEIKRMDAALLCLPPQLVGSVAHEVLQHGKSVVECAQLEGDAYQQHKARIHHIALRQRVPAIVGAGWEPGALSIFRHLFEVLTPKGHTETTHRPGISLHHSAWLRSVQGVKDALCTEPHSADTGSQRYVYVEFEPGADRNIVIDAIRNDPLFLDMETLVLPVESVAALEEEGHGVVVQRRGAAGRTGHQLLLLEARFDRWALAAQMMIAAARAVPGQAAGAHSLLDLPLSALTPFARNDAVKTGR
jgi:diaminopimelate dehydrogenase